MSLAHYTDGCPHCADLQERVAWLESELGIQHSHSDLLKLNRAFGLPPQCARLALALYAAKGAPVSRQRMEELSEDFSNSARGRGGLDGERSPEGVSVMAYRIRRYLGYDAVLCLRARGYALSDKGMAMVGEALGR